MTENHLKVMQAIRPSASRIDYDAFRAFMAQICMEMEQATAEAVRSIRERRESEGFNPASRAIPITRNKRPSLAAAHSSESKRIKIGAAWLELAKSEHNSRYNGHIFLDLEFSEGLVKFKNIANMPMYRIITCLRTDAEPTFTTKSKGTLANEPQIEYQDRRPLEYQNRARKNANTKAHECAFYHKLDDDSPQSIDWRRKLGHWLAECLGKADGEKYILDAFPKGFTMWEHVRGCWVKPSNPESPVDPTKLIIFNGQLYTEAEAVESGLTDSAWDKSAKGRQINEELGFDMKALDVASAGSDGPRSDIEQYEQHVFATEKEIHALDPRQQPRFTKKRDDLYLYGYKDNKRYAAPNEFFAHLLWLATARSSDGKVQFPCTCKHCDYALDKERGANKADRIELAFNKWKEAIESLQ